MKHARLWIALGFAVLLLGCTTAPPVPDTHSSRNSLDWAGSYMGTLPCADCPGIETAVTLYEDGRYQSQRRYLERSDTIYREPGNFTWDSSGGVVVLDGVRYRVGENKITLLDQQGERITGDLADHYVLSKLPPPDLTGTYWRLTVLRGQPVADTPRPAHIRFDAAESRVSGSGGCNVISGSYELQDPNRLHFGQMISTKMACMTGMDTEQAFLEVLGQVDSYALNGGQLQLLRARMAPLATFEADYLR